MRERERNKFREWRNKAATKTEQISTEKGREGKGNERSDKNRRTTQRTGDERQNGRKVARKEEKK